MRVGRHVYSAGVEGSLKTRLVWVLRRLRVFANRLQRRPGVCVCTAGRADHQGENTVGRQLQLPLTVPVVEPHLLQSPGPGRLRVDPGPITHSFQAPQPSRGNVNDRRAASTSRAVIRNRGGIPTPARPQAQRTQQVQGRNTQARQLESLKLMFLCLPFHVSVAPASGSLFDVATH